MLRTDSTQVGAGHKALAGSFDSWWQLFLLAPGHSPECICAIHGDPPVGMTFIKRLSDVAAENDSTGVARAYRGNRIAAELKVRAIDWGREHGMER